MNGENLKFLPSGTHKQMYFLFWGLGIIPKSQLAIKHPGGITCTQ